MPRKAAKEQLSPVDIARMVLETKVISVKGDIERYADTNGLTVTDLIKNPSLTEKTQDERLLKAGFWFMDNQYRRFLEENKKEADLESCLIVRDAFDTRICELDEEWEIGRLVIQTKEGSLTRFNLRHMQKFLYKFVRIATAEKLAIRIMLLKPRQFGGSTLIEAIIYLRSKRMEGTNGYVVAHSEKGARTIFTMYKRFYRFDIARRPARVGEEKLIYEDNYGGEIHVASGYNAAEGRGATVHWMHLSEAAFYRTSESF